MEQGYKTVELPDTVPGIGYTLKHRNCVEELIRYYCAKAVGKRTSNGEEFTKTDYNIMINRAKCHDMDKLLTSLAYPQMTADYLHRLFNGHHEESMVEPEQKSKYDWMEMIFDMESAHYTKADKQSGNGYAFASTCKRYIMPYLQPYYELLGLIQPETIDEIKKKVNRKYYETDLVEAIVQYMHTLHIHLLDGISRIDDRGYMMLYNKPVPLRHPSTQKPGGTMHNRPSRVVTVSPRLTELEFIHGTFEAQLFDYDRICSIPVSDLPNWNGKALNVLKEMAAAKKQR